MRNGIRALSWRRSWPVSSATRLDEAIGLADLGLRLDEAKRLTAALQAEMVQAQMAALSEYPRACEACGRRLAAKGHYGADVLLPVRRGAGAGPAPVCLSVRGR